MLSENHWARAPRSGGPRAAAAGRRLQRALRPPQRPSPRVAHIRVAACFDVLFAVAFILSFPCLFLPLNTTSRFCWLRLRLRPMSPLIPPLFPPLLPRRHLCHCPSFIDVPASITILLAAAVCVVPLMLLPMQCHHGRRSLSMMARCGCRC